MVRALDAIFRETFCLIFGRCQQNFLRNPLTPLSNKSEVFAVWQISVSVSCSMVVYKCQRLFETFRFYLSIYLILCYVLFSINCSVFIFYYIILSFFRGKIWLKQNIFCYKKKKQKHNNLSKFIEGIHTIYKKSYCKSLIVLFIWLIIAFFRYWQLFHAKTHWHSGFNFFIKNFQVL